MFGSKDKCEICTKVVYADEKLVLDGKFYHSGCFKCNKCGTKLKTTNFAKLEGNYFCKPHFQEAFKLRGKYEVKKDGSAPAEAGDAAPAAPAEEQQQ